MTFEEMLAMIEERSGALRAAAARVDLDSLVPGCPDWSVRDLVVHLGDVQRSWAVIVAAGPSAKPPADEEFTGLEPADGEDLMSWSAASTRELVRALAAAGPDRGCWAWWAGASEAPANAGSVARHQVQEAAVHAFDAQEAAGQPEPLPGAVAADGVGEYLTVGLASLGPWPHDPGQIALAASDGDTAWTVSLGADGARAAPGAAGTPGARIVGTASDLVLGLYRRNTQEDLEIEGDEELAEQLLDWPDND